MQIMSKGQKAAQMKVEKQKFQRHAKSESAHFRAGRQPQRRARHAGCLRPGAPASLLIITDRSYFD